MSELAYTIVLHGNDATGKSTLAPALKAAGEVVYARGDEDVTLEDTLVVRTFDRLTLQLADDDRAPLPISYTDKEGVQRRIVRIVLDADLPILQARLAKRASTDKWESEKSLFYFRTRFLELAAFYGLPVVDTGKKSVDETVADIVGLARKPEVLALFSRLALRTLTPGDVASLASRRVVIPGVDYDRRLKEIIDVECGETSIFTPEDVRVQCHRDPGLVHELVNQYDQAHDANAPLRLDLVAQGESKQIYKVKTKLTCHFDHHVLVLLKPTIYSHSKQATAEIAGLSSIRASGSRLFLEMLHRAGIQHTYEGLNAHGIIWARSTEITPIETVYKTNCIGTDKHSFFDMATNAHVTSPTGQYKRGPYIRFDWRNPNHTYKGVNPATHPFYHAMEASVGKNAFYVDYLTARATPLGDKCVPEELVHGVQAVEASVEATTHTFFTIQHYLHQVGLEVQDGCIMLDASGRTIWSEINQDCMRIKKKREVVAATNGQSNDAPPPTHAASAAFDKDVWRAGGSAAKESIVDKWTELNRLLGAHLASRPFHEHEMLSSSEPYALHAQQLLVDDSLSLTPRYRTLYERLVVHDRSRSSSSFPSSSSSSSSSLTINHGTGVLSSSSSLGEEERLLARMQAHVWQLPASTDKDHAAQAGRMVRLVGLYARQVGLTTAQVASALGSSPTTTTTTTTIPTIPTTISTADAVLTRGAAAVPGWSSSSSSSSSFKAIGVTAKKYADKTDDFMLTQLGVKLVRSTGRGLRIDYEIVDAAQYAQAFGDGVSVHFVPTKPKDMPGLIAQGTLDGAVTYSSVMDNFPMVARLVASVADTGISLALIARRGCRIDPATWTTDKPARIAAEHVRTVRAYLARLDVPPDTYDIHRVLGSSESYLVNDPRQRYLLCDAIVSTGSTLQANELDVWRVVKPKGDLVVGLYQRL